MVEGEADDAARVAPPAPGLDHLLLPLLQGGAGAMQGDQAGIVQRFEDGVESVPVGGGGPARLLDALGGDGPRHLVADPGAVALGQGLRIVERLLRRHENFARRVEAGARQHADIVADRGAIALAQRRALARQGDRPGRGRSRRLRTRRRLRRRRALAAEKAFQKLEHRLVRRAMLTPKGGRSA